MAPPGRPKTTSTSQASRLRMSDWAPVSFTVAPGGAVVGARKKPPARGRGGSARAAYGGGPALVDKYQGDPGRHQASCPGLRLRFSDGTGGVKRADGGTSVTDLLEGAAGFVWRSGRLIDRHRLAHLFLGGERAPVLAALAAYQNPDGGFGNALEPDLRGPGSQPEPVEVAFWVLDEVGAMDDPMVAAACDWLGAGATPGGGGAVVLPSPRGDTP